VLMFARSGTLRRFRTTAAVRRSAVASKQSADFAGWHIV
jgi:hypothetical protein